MEMKKVLSLVLSLCLFVSLGAGISFDVAEAAATDLYFDFTVGGAAYPGKVDYTLIGTMTYDKVNELDTKNVSDDWAFHSTAVPSGDNVGGSGNDYITYIAKNGPIVINSYSRKEDYKLRIQFKVPNAGKYVPFVNFAAYSSGNGHNIPYTIYSVNDDGSLGSAISDTKWIHSNSAHTDNHYMAITDTALNLAAGTYVIEWGTVQTKSQVRVKGLKLAAADNNIATSLTIGKGENYFEVNEGAKIEIPMTVKMSDGSTLNLAGANGWQTTADSESVHTRVNKANGTFDITGLKENAKAETFEIKLGNAMARINIKVNAADYLAPDKNLVYDFTSAMAYDAQCNGGNTLLYGSSATNYALSNAGKAYGAAKSNKTSEPWKITGKRDKSGNAKPNLYFNAFMATNIGIYFYDAGSADVQFLVANDGYYVPSVTFYSTAPAADVTIAVKKMDGTVLATKTFAKGANGGATVNITDEAIKMPAGEYMLTFTKATASAMVYTNAFTLAYKSGFTYNVSLDAGAGTAASDVTSYTHGTAVTLPAVTAPEGYTFDGWADANGKVVTAIAALERGDKAYTAKYTKIPSTFAVTLNANGGTVAADLTSYTEGVGATLPAATKTGYVFGGWYDNADLIGTAVTAIGTDATGAKEFWAKWTLDVSAADFDLEASSGYYAYYVSNPNREGVIAITAAFAKYATAPISKAGIMIYVAGNEANEAKIARVEASAAEIAADPNFAGTVSAIFDGIAKENFDKEVLAKAYVVIDGEYIYSDAITTSVDSTRWVGVKPKN